MSRELEKVIEVRGGQPPITLTEENVSVVIHGKKRIPTYAEVVEIPESIYEQAQELGRRLLPVTEAFPYLLRNEEFRKKLGIDRATYENFIQPFENTDSAFDLFGVDAIIEDGQTKAIEINTRPQFLGRYDALNTPRVGFDNPNANVSPKVSEVLRKRIHGGSGVVVSHPLNAYHNQHRVFAEQIGFDLASLQDLTTDGVGNVLLNGGRVDVMFRQFAMNTFLNTEVTESGVIEAVQNGKVSMVNGPLADFLGEKVLLAHLQAEGFDLREFFPEMQAISSGDGTDLKDYVGSWLKTRTRGNTELTLRLTEKSLQGWRGRTIKAMVGGRFEEADEILGNRENSTAKRLRRHLEDIKRNNTTEWLLQEHVEPAKITVDSEYGPQDLNTTLRIYFVRNPNNKETPDVFLELFAGKFDRVSAAGQIIPLSRKSKTSVTEQEPPLVV